MLGDSELFIRCECRGLDHMAVFECLRQPSGSKDLYMSVHLAPTEGFWRRLLRGLRYAFGAQSRNSGWAEMIVTRDAAQRLQAVLDDFLSVDGFYDGQ